MEYNAAAVIKVNLEKKGRDKTLAPAFQPGLLVVNKSFIWPRKMSYLSQKITPISKAAAKTTNALL